MSKAGQRLAVYLGTFGVLVATVPWFFGQAADEPPVLGLPAWAAYTVGATVLYAIVIAWCLGRCWRLSADAGTPEHEDGKPERRDP